MSSAIEVLKEMQKFWIEGIELNKRNGDKTSPKELAELNALGVALLALEKPYRFSKEQLVNFILAYEKYTDKEHFEEGVNEMVANAFLEDIGFTKNGKEVEKVLGGN